MDNPETQTCPAIGLTCYPALGIYNQDIYYILPSEYQSGIPPLPFRLITELQRSELQNAVITYGTVVSDGRFLVDREDGKAQVNVLFHSYAFYDAEEGSNHQCFLPAAVYVSDTSFSAICTPSCPHGDFLCTNPHSIFSDRCRTEVFLHPRDEQMCCSPNNAKVLINVSCPLVVFFTLCLVPYKGRIVRGNVTRHIVIMDYTAGLTVETLGVVRKEEKSQLKEKLLANIDSPDTINDLISAALGTETCTNVYETFLHFLAWEVSGRPDSPNFGSVEYQRHMDAADLPMSSAWLRQLAAYSALDIAKWLQGLN